MSRAPLCENPRVDTPTVIPNPQTQMTFVILYLHLDMPCPGVVECIAQRLTRNPINVIAQDRIEVARRTLDRNIEERSILTCLLGCELFAEGLNRYSEIVGNDRG